MNWVEEAAHRGRFALPRVRGKFVVFFKVWGASLLAILVGRKKSNMGAGGDAPAKMGGADEEG